MTTRTLLLLSLPLLGACTQREEPRLALERPHAVSSAPSPWVKVRSPAGIPLLEAPARSVGPPDAEAPLSPPFAARVGQVHVRVGDRVERDAPLVDVVMPEVVGAAGRLAAAQIRIDAQARRKAQLDALAKHGLARLADRAEAEGALGEARAEHLVASSILGAAGLSPKDASRLVEGGGVVTLRSPIAGVVVSVDAPIGSIREAGGAPLVRVAGTGPGRVVARAQALPPEDATLSFVSGRDEPVPLALLTASPLVDPHDGTRELFLEPARPIPPGVSGVLRISLPEGSRGAVAVPALAVFLEEGEAFVFRREGDEAREVPVQVLASSGTDALVRGELSVEDEVAADAIHFGAGKPEEGGGHH
ncbi:MAG TPA: efflux RND transporter periplasmic adaptor subunit [Vulgatibacter sp.]|nr:efflux RND transporter periplasmic adaptor subunit [Vulgatibacter sp.]